MGREEASTGSEAFSQLAQVEWDSPRVRRQWPVEASTSPLPHGQYQAPAIEKVNFTGIHFSTEILQVASHCSMVERRKVQPHLGLRRRDPPAQLEERHQTFPSTRLIALPKVVIPDPHAQIRKPNLQ
jgi:hypothetical protein